MSRLKQKSSNLACRENDLQKYVVVELETPSTQLTEPVKSENVFQIIFNHSFLLMLNLARKHYYYTLGSLQCIIPEITLVPLCCR